MRLPPLQPISTGPFWNPSLTLSTLINALETWSDSLEVLFNDLVSLADALVDVEYSFAACEEEIMQSLSQAASQDAAGGGDPSEGSLYKALQAMEGQDANGGAE